MKKNQFLARAAMSAFALVAAGALSGCVSPSASKATGNYTRPIGDAPVTANPTPYSAALVCLGNHARMNNRGTPRIAVGRIIDYTGKVDSEGGRKITQGASLMAMTAFAKAGARLVERFDTSVSELELKYANNKLIGEGQMDGDFRKIMAGQVEGSDYYLVGGITEMNYNIRSVGADAFIGQTATRDTKGNLGAKLFVMNIGLDLRLVDTKSLEVVDVISYQKQIIGREVRAGVFSFWDDTLFDVGAGERALEPIQLAVRAATERAVLEMMANLYGVETQDVCKAALKSDPLAGNGATGDFKPRVFATANQAAMPKVADRRADPNAWNDKRDAKMEAALKPVEAPKTIPTKAKPAAKKPTVGRPVAAPVSVAPNTKKAQNPVPVTAKRPVRTTTQSPATVNGLRPTTSPTDTNGLRGSN
jgi:curli production assembly/transport component CsgG/holdfast attachment protein HfaB